MKKNIAFPSLTPPQTERRPHADTRHNITRIDEYAWLRAENWQEVFRNPAALDPAIRSHLEAENAYQAALMDDTAELRKTLFAEMKGRIKEDDSTVPMKDGPYAYGSSFKLGGEQPRYFRTPRDGGPEEIILDGDHEAEGKAYFRIGGRRSFVRPPPPALGLRRHGLRVLRAACPGRWSAAAILMTGFADTGGSGVWSAANDGFFYTRVDASHRPSKIFFHDIGMESSGDRLIYEESDPGFFMSVGGTRSNEWIFISINDHETSEYRIFSADDPLGTPLVVSPRETGLQYDLEEGGDVFFILTNADGAKDFKIVTAPVSDPSRANWRELVPHEPGRLILSILSFRDFLVRLERKDGLPRIVIRDRSNGEEHLIAFDEEAFSLGLSGSFEYDTDIMRFTYSSMTTPAQVFDYNMRTASGYS